MSLAGYDKNNKEVFKSDQQIVLADRKLVFGKEPSNYSLILYSTKAKKALNDSESLADKISIGNSYLYKFSANEKTYLYNSVGDKLKVINNANASFIYSTETIMYIENDKVFIINPSIKTVAKTSGIFGKLNFLFYMGASTIYFKRK